MVSTKHIDDTDCHVQIRRHAFYCMVPLAYQVAAVVVRFTREEDLIIIKSTLQNNEID